MTETRGGAGASHDETRVLIVDDQADIRLLVRTLITAANRELRVAGEAASGEEALRWLETDTATVVVLDHTMPGMTGIETARRMRLTHPALRILLFTAYLSPDVRRDAESAGVTYCLGKEQVVDIAAAVRLVAA